MGPIAIIGGIAVLGRLLRKKPRVGGMQALPPSDANIEPLIHAFAGEMSTRARIYGANEGYSKKEIAAIGLHTYRNLGGTRPQVIRSEQRIMGLPQTGVYDPPTVENTGELLEDALRQRAEDGDTGVLIYEFAREIGDDAEVYGETHGYDKKECVAIFLHTFMSLGGEGPEIMISQMDLGLPQTGAYDARTVKIIRRILENALREHATKTEELVSTKKGTSKTGGMEGLPPSDSRAVAPAVAVVISKEAQAILNTPDPEREPVLTLRREDRLSGEEMAHLFMERSVTLTLLLFWQQKASEEYDSYALAYKKQGRFVLLPEPRPGVITKQIALSSQGLDKRMDTYQSLHKAAHDMELSTDKLREAILSIYGVVAYDLVLDMIGHAIIVEQNQFKPTMESCKGHGAWGTVPLLSILKTTQATLIDDDEFWTEDEA